MKLLVGLLIATCSVAYADCSLNITNKSSSEVTLAGLVKSESGVVVTLPWLTVPANSKASQIVSGLDVCNVAYKYSDNMALSVILKNNSGSWVGNKGFLYSKDSSYAKISAGGAKGDDNQPITLSNGLEITAKQFNVQICNSSITSDECN